MLSSTQFPSLERAQQATLQSIQRLSSAKRINSAADDAAGLAVADGMTSRLGGKSQAASNITSALSVTDTAGGALNQVTDNLQRIRELTVQAGNGSLSTSDRQGIQDEIDGLGKNIDDIASNTEFNGQKLLDGSFTSQFQVGSEVSDSLGLSLSSTSSSALGVSGLSIATPANAVNALDKIDKAISNVGEMQGQIAGTAAGLNTHLANVNSSYQSLAQARGRIQDTDYAQASTELNQNRLQNRIAAYAVKLYQDNQKNGVAPLL